MAENRPPGSSQAEQALPTLARAARECGAAAYAVGGYIRDRLLGVETADVDVVVTQCLGEIAERLHAELGASVVPLHDEQPTIRVAFRGRSHIDLTIPRTGSLLPADDVPAHQRAIVADLLARDFTINAMAVALDDLLGGDWQSHIIDPAAGVSDLRVRLIRATNPQVWLDDPLRLWRALRLAAQLGFELEDDTVQGMREHADLALRPATERIRDEFFALLARPNAEIWLAQAADIGLLFKLLPELAPLRSLSQGGYHHLDGWHHSLAVAAAMRDLVREAPGLSSEKGERLRRVFGKSVSGGRPKLALLTLAGLMHDAGKPSTRAEDDEGFVHFYGHEKVSAEMARAVADRLCLSRRETHYLEAVTGLHMYPALLAQQEISRRAAHRFFRKAGNVAPDILVLAWADRLSALGPAALPEHIERVQNAIRWLLTEWLEESPLSHPQPPVGARAIMRRYGLEPGPEVGRALRVLLRRHAEEPFAHADAAWAFLDRVVARPGANPVEPKMMRNANADDPVSSSIDLHVHTTASDGTLSPEAAVASAAEVGVDVLGIADHDILDGLAAALAAGERLGVTVVPGVEINTDYGETEAHVLGYFIDHTSADLNGVLGDIRQRRVERAREMIERLDRLGLRVNEGRVLELAAGGSVGRPHVARALVEAGYVKTGAEAFGRYIGRGQPAYVPRYRLTPAAAVQAIRGAGGIAVLAHPAKVGDDVLVQALIAQGMDGLEAFHCDNSAAHARHYVSMARQLGILVTGGTDSHGPHSDRPVAIGAVAVPRWVWEELAAFRACRRP